ncbi:MAG: initiation control protein YabA [Bacillota bacterium]
MTQPLGLLLRQTEMRMQEILQDFSRIKRYAQLLEEENQRLKEALAALARGEGDAAAGVNGEAGGQLAALYRQGFHVCHAAFGGLREQECLFCLALLRGSSRRTADPANQE